jgi:hypothetical protein
VGAGDPESLPCRPSGVGGLEGAMRDERRYSECREIDQRRGFESKESGSGVGGIRVEGGLGGHSQISPNSLPIVELEYSLRSEDSIDIGWSETNLVGSVKYRVYRG